MVISWAQLRLDRSLADFMTSSRLNVFGGLDEGVQRLLDESLVKLSREHSRSLADVTLSQRSSDDSASLPWSSQLDVEGGCSSFSGMLLHYSSLESPKKGGET